ncbi:MAG: hypothetical protein ABSC91_10755 [Candidatus Bathyarchaeia archaeon]
MHRTSRREKLSKAVLILIVTLLLTSISYFQLKISVVYGTITGDQPPASGDWIISTGPGTTVTSEPNLIINGSIKVNDYRYFKVYDSNITINGNFTNVGDAAIIISNSTIYSNMTRTNNYGSYFMLKGSNGYSVNITNSRFLNATNNRNYMDLELNQTLVNDEFRGFGDNVLTNTYGILIDPGAAYSGNFTMQNVHIHQINATLQLRYCTAGLISNVTIDEIQQFFGLGLGASGYVSLLSIYQCQNIVISNLTINFTQTIGTHAMNTPTVYGFGLSTGTTNITINNVTVQGLFPTLNLDGGMNDITPHFAFDPGNGTSVFNNCTFIGAGNALTNTKVGGNLTINSVLILNDSDGFEASVDGGGNLTVYDSTWINSDVSLQSNNTMNLIRPTFIVNDSTLSYHGFVSNFASGYLWITNATFGPINDTQVFEQFDENPGTDMSVPAHVWQFYNFTSDGSYVEMCEEEPTYLNGNTTFANVTYGSKVLKYTLNALVGQNSTSFVYSPNGNVQVITGATSYSYNASTGIITVNATGMSTITLDWNVYWMNFTFRDMLQGLVTSETWQLYNGTQLLSYQQGQTSLYAGTYTLDTYYHGFLLNISSLPTTTYGNTVVNISLNMYPDASGYIAANTTFTGIVVTENPNVTPGSTIFTANAAHVLFIVDVSSNVSSVVLDGSSTNAWTQINGTVTYINFTDVSFSSVEIDYFPPTPLSAPFFAITVALVTVGSGFVYWFYRRTHKSRSGTT